MYKSLDVLNSGGGVVPNSVVYKYSDPFRYPVSKSKISKYLDISRYRGWSKEGLLIMPYLCNFLVNSKLQYLILKISMSPFICNMVACNASKGYRMTDKN